MRRALQLVSRAGSELALLAFAIVVAYRLAASGRAQLAAIVLALGMGTAAAALVWLWWSGVLPLAWLAPQLDALGLKTRTRLAPWRTLRAAEEALELLAAARPRYPHFLPDARAAILRCADRGIELHRRGSGLRDDGARKDVATRSEIDDIDALLCEIGAQLRIALQSGSAESARSELVELHQRSGALADAVKEVTRGAS